MASNESYEVNIDDNDLCCIEASVVTGFEECARGEAKEKFNIADVKAARGKISWKIPIQCVKEVVKMGSIDNCRVLIHSNSHFGFTDQHESLASLQKLVLNIDWDQGLRVWKKFNETFPHPVKSNPDVIPAPEDLIDVVIAPQREKTEKKSRNKKGGKWKKDKRNSKGKAADEEGKDSQTGNKEEVPDTTIVSKEVEKDCATAIKTEIKSDDLSSTTPVSEQGTDGIVSVDENGTKKVVIKQVDPNKPSPEIKIKVLIPGPDENVFPTDISDKDQRDLEPMEVDRSMHQVSHTDSISKSGIGESDSSKDERKDLASSPSASSPPKSLSSPFKQPSAPISIFSSAKDFASSVIERLTSSSPQSSTTFITNDDASSLPSCVTPPSTPVHQNLDLFMKSKSDKNLKSTSVDSNSHSNDSSVDSGKVNIVSPSNKSPLAFTTSSSVDNDNKFPTYSSDKILEPKTESQHGGNTISQESSNVDNDKASPVKKERDPTKPTFRVTCNRVGDHHAFDSSSAAASLGSAIIKYFGWSVDLKNFDIEVLLNIDNEEVTVGLGITRASLHNRNLVAFGPTTLRATICYNMLRLCRVRNGDFVCDPMCGTSAIPIEGTINWVNCYFFGGDYHDKGIERSLLNIDATRQKQIQEQKVTMKIDAVQWNIEHFPLRDKCVDVFVSDLPFGHRMGSRTTNRTLYPSLLFAMARTARPGARACLLTEDKTSLIKALQTTGGMWQRRLILHINMGGLSGHVFLMTRTTTPYTAPSSGASANKSWRKQEEGEDNTTTMTSTSSVSAHGDGVGSGVELQTTGTADVDAGSVSTNDDQTATTITNAVTVQSEKETDSDVVEQSLENSKELTSSNDKTKEESSMVETADAKDVVVAETSKKEKEEKIESGEKSVE